MELNTLDYLCITFLTKNGDFYTLTPLLLSHMVFREEQFSNFLVLLNDMLSDFEEEAKDQRMIKLLKMTLVEGK